MLDSWNPSLDGLSVLAQLNVTNKAIVLRNVNVSVLEDSLLNSSTVFEHVRIYKSKVLQWLHLSDLSTVRKISLYKTHLAGIWFRDNLHLQHLSIAYAPLAKIDPSVVTLQAIREIDVRHTNLHVLDLKSFYTFDHFTRLVLSNNKLKVVLGVRNTISVSKLKIITLRYNQLKAVDLEVFNTFTWLEKFDVSFNKIDTLTGILSTGHLKRLLLASNCLSQLNFCQWPPLNVLERLDVSLNHLTEAPDCLEKLSQVSRIMLNGNNISTITMATFASLRHLRELNLASNMIKAFSFGSPAPRFPPSLERMYLYQNCLCSLIVPRNVTAQLPMLQIYLFEYEGISFECYVC
uniref:Leucine rich immune protein (Coil-less) n=1 Tax=Anopheles farauti TaxID=69004 RepID=A0A182QH53_9DIPT